jgi:hypothetical protein
MRKLLVSFLLLLLVVLTGCSKDASKSKPDMISGADNDPEGGADLYDNLGDHEDSMYWVNPDFYNMKFNDHLTILTNYKTFLQTTEWSCGPATVLTVLNHFGLTNYTEWDISVGTHASTDEDTEGALPGTADNFYEYGTNVAKLYQYLNTLPEVKVIETSFRADYTDADLIKAEDGYTGNDVGNLYPTFSSNALYASENSSETNAWVEDAKDSYFVKWIVGHLNANQPIMVEWGDWDGHWQAIIGYDTLGTPGIGDDVIIFADPYDTSDHWQDGYYYYNAERWFFMWADRNVAPKPYQLQPYIVIDLKNK